jgi:acetylglutamate kinase
MKFDSATKKAEILVEALPYIQEFHGKLVVIKYGGAAMIDCELKAKVMKDIVLMKLVGMHPIVVHGGGPEINDMLSRLDLETSFVDGMRVTDETTMEVVEMVLGGKVNKDIVAGLNASGGKAVGISGKDDNLIISKYLDQNKGMGFVGQVKKVNPQIIFTLIKNGYIPVIAPIGTDSQQQSFNINADLVASAVAVALEADKLILLTDTPGLLRDAQDPESLISVLKISEIEGLKGQGVISGGMLPKIQCCFEAVQGGVGSTHIIDGRLPHAILLEIFTKAGVGTMVINE